MSLQALGNRIIVEAVKKEDDGIIVPESSRTNDQEKAKVLSVGPGRVVNGGLDVPGVAVGDIIYYSPFGATKLKYEDKEYLILNNEDILAVEK